MSSLNRNNRKIKLGWTLVLLLVSSTFLLGWSLQALAQNESDTSTEVNSDTSTKGETIKINTTKAGQILLLILVLAILLETGLSTLFNWRLFLLYGEGRGIKTPIAFVVALLFVTQFKIDAIAEILTAFAVGGQEYKEGTGGMILTALIVAGGSSGIFTLFERLGIRNPLQRKETAEAMRQKSHLKVQVTRHLVARTQPIQVKLDEKIIGVIEANNNRFGKLIGHPIESGEHSLEISGLDDKGEPRIEKRDIAVAPGATVVESFRL